MIKVGKSKVRNLAKELTLKEWEVVRVLIERVQEPADDLGAIDAFNEIFQMLGATEEDCDELTASELYRCIQEFKQDKIDNKFERTIKLKGKTFEAYEAGKKFILNGKKMGLIERFVKAYGSITFPEMLAALFKDKDATVEEHFDIENLRERAVLFESAKASVAAPYLATLGVEITEIVKLKEAENGATEKVE